MSQLGILIGSDIRGVRAWFSTRSGSKLLVLLGFLTVTGIVSAGLYKASGYYFSILSGAGTYGYQTAVYIIRASVLILIWLGIGSGAAGAVNIFLTRSRSLSYILTQPVPAGVISVWQITRTVILNMILLGILIIPVMISFDSQFTGAVGMGLFIRLLTGLFSLSSVTVALGGMVGLMVLRRAALRPFLTSFLGLILFLMGLLFLFRIVFPPSLELLTYAAPSAFDGLYRQLPLAGDLFPGNWLAGIFTGTSSVFWLSGIGLAVIFSGIYYWYQQSIFIRLFHLVNAVPADSSEHTLRHSRSLFRIEFSGRSPRTALIIKDLSAIFRSAGEAAYSVFLFSLLLFFFGLFSRIKISPETPVQWIDMARVFAFLGMLFFADTFLLRMSFPAMAREGRSAWYLFTRPLKRSVVWSSKLFYSLLVSLPFVLSSLVIWIMPGFTRDYYLSFTLMSVISLLTLAAIHAFMGMINPNFSEAESAEKISTSPMGIACLVVSSALAGGTGFILNRFLSSDPSWQILVLSWLLVTITAVGILALFSRRQVSEYQF